MARFIHVYNAVLLVLLVITVEMMTSAKAGMCTELLPFTPKFCDGDNYVSDDCWERCRVRYYSLIKATCDYMVTFPGPNKSVCKCWYNC
ncbi:hypothetical protein R6Q59_027061 [Mikania micrantha]